MVGGNVFLHDRQADAVAAARPGRLALALVKRFEDARRVVRRHARPLVGAVDQGPGVAPNDTARIFEPFYQGQRQPPGARRGNGIGLSIVQELSLIHISEPTRPY